MKCASLGRSDHGRLPLCSSYAMVHLREFRFICGWGQARKEHYMPWALGVCGDGQLEVLGVWHRSLNVAGVPESVAEDLHMRGLVGVRMIVCSGSPEFDMEVLRAYPRATVVRPFREWCIAATGRMQPHDRPDVEAALTKVRLAATREAAIGVLNDLGRGEWRERPEAVEACRDAVVVSTGLYALSRRLRRAALLAEATGHRLHVGAQAALRRSSSFADPQTAAGVAELRLTRAVRQLNADVPAPRGSRGRIARLGSMSREPGFIPGATQ